MARTGINVLNATPGVDILGATVIVCVYRRLFEAVG